MGLLSSITLGFVLAISQTQVAQPSLASPQYPLSQDPFSDPLIIDIQALHSKSEAGDKKATQKLIKKLKDISAEQPDNYLVLAYLGSAYTLASRDAFPGPSKLRYLKEGLATMDKAVKKAPDQPCVRFIRAINNFHLPAFINRRDNAREDFEKLVEQLEEQDGKKFEYLNTETKQAIYYYAGLSFKQLRRKDDAKETWEKGVVLDSSSELSSKMSKELGKLKG